MSETDHDTDCDLLVSAGAYSGRPDDDDPCVQIGVDRSAPVRDDFTAFIASTFDEDRHNTVFDQNTWRLANYRANPVVLLNHYSLPIGRGKAWIEKHGTPEAHLRNDVQWDMSDPQAVLIAGKYAQRFMNAGSIRFNPDTVKATDRNKLPAEHFAYRKPRENDSPWRPALFFERAELIEFSAVTVPSNTKAVALRHWGVSPVLAEIEAAAIAATEDPDEQIRRVVAEFLTRERVGLVMGALDVPEVGARVRAVVFPAAPRPAPSADPWAGFFRSKEG